MLVFFAKRIVVIAALILIASLSRCSDADEVEELVHEFRKDKPFVGVAVGVINADVSAERFFGPADGEEKEITKDTLFEIGSITKTFTGLLLADAVLAKKVELTDAANTHLPPDLQLPSFETEDPQPIQLLHLATHHSGLPVQPAGLPIFAVMSGTPTNPYSKFNRRCLTLTLSHLKLPRLPGEFQYSNLGAGLLGHALVAANDAESYEALVKERILKPLEMNSTKVVLDEDDQAMKATGHTSAGVEVPGWDFVCLEGCGALRSSLGDMIKYAVANIEKQPASLGKAIELAQDEHELFEAGENGDAKAHGLGWVHIETPGIDNVVLFHNGGTGGYRSFLGIVRETKTAVVVLSNSDHSVDPLGLDILKSIQPSD